MCQVPIDREEDGSGRLHSVPAGAAHGIRVENFGRMLTNVASLDEDKQVEQAIEQGAGMEAGANRPPYDAGRPSRPCLDGIHCRRRRLSEFLDYATTPA